MLVAISGSQGSGKSTVINQLKDLGYNTIERKTSRTILDRFGKTLEEVYSDPILHQQFQIEVLKLKIEDEAEAIASSDVWYGERTFADVFSYALFNLGNKNDQSEFIDNYYTECAYQNKSYAAIFYLEAGHFQVEHDGVRGINQHYSKAMDMVMLDFTQEMLARNQYFEIITDDVVDDRVSAILSYCPG